MGKIFHVAVDLTLIAGFLSGVKKNTGVTPNIGLIGEPNVEYYAYKYLDYGDYVYDNAASFMRNSRFFVKGLY